MFKEWGFLLGEIWVLLALAALVGLIAGWLIWGGRRAEAAGGAGELVGLKADLERAKSRADAAEAELAAARGAAAQAGAGALSAESAAQLRAQLDSCHDGRSDAENRIEALEAQLAEVSVGGAVDLSADLAACQSAQADAAARIAELEGDLAACRAANAEPSAAANTGATSAGFVDVGRRPEGLSAARGGQPDDLKLIKGVGPKLEKLCNSLGFWHFDQVAAWTADEIAWVDENLEGFKGRVSRDEWAAQAKLLAQGITPGA